MQYRIKTLIFDPLSIEALDSLIASRKMARFICEEVAHYVRTKDGKALLKTLTSGSAGGSEKKHIVPVDKKPVRKDTMQPVDIGGFLSIKRDVSG